MEGKNRFKQLSPRRIVAITSGFEPDEGGSIPSAGANFIITLMLTFLLFGVIYYQYE